MRDDKVIAQAKRNQNLLTLDLTLSDQCISVKCRPTIMAVIGPERTIHLVHKNKCICMWH